MNTKSPANRALFFGWLSAVPLLVWWVGWFPGFMSSDSIDQLGQVDRFDFFNFHPVSHTFSLWLATRVWDHPGAITLLQVLVLADLLGLVARRLTQTGVPWWRHLPLQSSLAGDRALRLRPEPRGVGRTLPLPPSHG